MTARLKIGVALHPQHTAFADYARGWRRADELGVDSIWSWDHFFPLTGDPNGAHFEGWTSLAALGPQTRNAQVGCLVLCMAYRNPALLSQMAKTLDHATGGRLILGLGAGWFRRDFEEYGYEFCTPGERLRHLERGIEIIKARWARDEPKPVRGTIPILIGGAGEKVTLRIAALHADLWHGFGSPTEWGRSSRVLDDWCLRVGRDPASIARSVFISEEWREDPIADMRRHHATLDAYAAAGATHIFYGLGAPFNFAPVEQLLAWRDAYRG
ncbi:MAG TPA: LLM class F420-dependent oxidoreductase [Candidatus Dormibacteraeota bacterium]